jgi:hypothetical protein
MKFIKVGITNNIDNNSQEYSVNRQKVQSTQKMMGEGKQGD